MPRLRVLVFRTDERWLDAFTRGGHDYLVPAGPGHHALPGAARAVPPEGLADAGVDVAVLQRPEELELVTRWLGRCPGRDLPAIYVEHRAPAGAVPDSRHPLADRHDICLVHVAHFNELMWDAGTTPTTVIEPGIPDPGELYSGELARAAVLLEWPLKRPRMSGTDLLPRFAEGAELDVFGTGLAGLNAALNLGEHRLYTVCGQTGRQLHEAMARRRVYLQPARWTAPDLALVEAMQLGMPVVGLATTETARMVPPEAGLVSTAIDEVTAALRELVGDRAMARQQGKQAREYALTRYGLEPFLRRWDDLLRHTAR
ncbi:glycosyltransferase [Actinophytocola sp.]|uniref:glycosyltransferase n=1 Tax=Actinophytocola sp. TaxID=1872138 RepID=UPI002D7E6303|nr:glycosyltransferase [Actinophytocola sp.]HET9141810.1 glycosyltransferase [Actinophytocola sp.]